MPFSKLLTSARLIARPGITVLVISMCLAVSACGNGDLLGGSLSGNPSTGSPSPGTPSPGTPSPGTPSPGTPSPGTPGTANKAPSINGTPPSTAKVNQPYQFSPNAFDPDNDPLTFQIAGKPAWASFDTKTGRLYGTPPAGTSGTFGGVQIAVTDGQAKATLPAFSIVVLESAPVTSGSAALSWTRPTQNTDGSSLTDLAGYRVYYGQDPSAQGSFVEITDPAATGTSIAPLSAGTWYFAISSMNKSGVESARTATVWLTIG